MKFRLVLAALALSAMAACGGGGGGGSSSDPSGKVTITATAPSTPVGAGGSLQIDVDVRNVSATAVANVVAQVSLGSGLTLTGTTCSAEGGAVCPTDPSTMSVASLPGSSILHYVLTASLAAGSRGPIAASASVTADGAPLASADQVSMTVQAFSADVQVSGTAANTTLIGGGTGTYTMTVTNAGPDAASNVHLEDTVDSYQTLGAVACVAAGGAVCPSTLGAVMSVPTLPMGGTLTFTVQATIQANAVGSIFNTLHATMDGDPLTSNNVATATAAVASQGTSFITLQSDSGDYIGLGQSYAYSSANAQLSVTASGGTLHVAVTGNDRWTGDFAEPSSLTQLQPGTYQNLARFASRNAAVGGIDWNGDARGCNTDLGSMTITNATYSNGVLTALDMSFEQHCEGAAPALHGQIHWLASDRSTAPGPANPPPATLWQAPPGATPASGNYVYLQSDNGDYIGAGLTQVYTQANAVLTTALAGAHLSVGVKGSGYWNGEFLGMNFLNLLQPGYYPGLQNYSLPNPVTGGLSWTGNGAACNTLTGWFAIDDITVTAGVLTAVDLRFEQHCGGATAALHGQIHWAAGDTTAPAGPQYPVPTSLWRAPTGATPSSGNYVYLQSDAGDFVGEGATVTYTQANSVLALTQSGVGLGVTITGDDNWLGGLQGMNSISQLQPGYYANLAAAGSNPVTGGLAWSGGGRGCDTETGWFVIDSITWSGGTLASVDARFEQHCDGATAALHGQIHWVSGDPTTPPGPQSPVPAGLWTPPAGSTPASGSYVYLQSDAADYIGGGQTTLLTPATSTISIGNSGALFYIYAADWTGNFVAMDSIAQLQPGYYPNAGLVMSSNPTRGQLSWSGGDRSCTALTGWFAIDRITYVGSMIVALDLRFEQHCQGLPAALHGQIHWGFG